VLIALLNVIENFNLNGLSIGGVTVLAHDDSRRIVNKQKSFFKEII
tara:strand:- start:174 stop:311 length:138 start_codon:yes stop_codon:yes gene_type:complete